MKYYILLVNYIAGQSIPEFDEDFPGVPIDQRFSPDFLCACVESDTQIQSGWIYDAEMGNFSEPPPPEPITYIPPEPDRPVQPNYMAFITGMMEGYTSDR